MKFFSRSIICRRGIVGAIFLSAVIFSTYYLSRSTCAAGLVPCTNDCNLCYLLVGISNIFQWLMGSLLTVAFLLGITIAGMSYMVSGTFPKALTFAKSAFANSLKGFLLALCAWIILNGIMNIVGYKNPQGGTWYQHVCSGGGAQVASTLTTCDPKNKKLESIAIQCAEQKETIADNGSGFFVALDTLSEDEKGKTKQLKAIGKFSCDGTTSEEDTTAQAEWKASDETQIKVAKGLVEAVTTTLGSSSETVPYVEAKYNDKNSNQAKVYINSCPNTTASIETTDEFSFSGNGLAIPMAYAQTTPPANKNCKSCGESSTCHFIYGNKDAKYIFIFMRATKPKMPNWSLNCSSKWTGDPKELKDFKEAALDFGRGIDLSKEKNDFGAYYSDLLDSATDESCPSGRKMYSYGYVYKGTPTNNIRALSLNRLSAAYCYLPYLFGSSNNQVFAHEQIGHGFAGLSDEYVVSAIDYKQFLNDPVYNCAAKQADGGQECKKWGTLTEKQSCYNGCFYSDKFMRSSYNSVMSAGSILGEMFGRDFGVVNDAIINWTAQDNHFPNGPAQWARP